MSLIQFDMKILKLKIEVADEVEAYQITSFLGFTHKIKRAELDKYIENFDEVNRPAYFLRKTEDCNQKFREKDDENFND